VPDRLEKLERERERLYALYLLTDIDVLWVDDGTRLAPDTQWFHERFALCQSTTLLVGFLFIKELYINKILCSIGES